MQQRSPLESRKDALEQLRHRITTGRMAPGEHLIEADLAEEFGLSRTPIRRIVRALADEGLVEIKPRRGAFVAEWTTSAEAAEIAFIRAWVESHAASLAAERRSDEQLGVLVSYCDEMDALASEQPEGFRTRLAELNQELHLAILEAAASPRLFTIAKDLVRAPLMSGAFEKYTPAELTRSLQDHRLMVEAITRRDGPSVRALMEAHIRIAYGILERHRNRA